MNATGATYRLQFNKQFTFRDLERIIDYLADLGIGTIYASPIFEAVPGSNHGYDGLNPHAINPEIGNENQLRQLAGQLKERRMGWLQDIVPNHMAYHRDNIWLVDVLENGARSKLGTFFDIDWHHPAYKGKLLAPFLGKDLKEAVEAGEITVAVIRDKTVFKYFDTELPLGSEGLDFIHSLHAIWEEALRLLHADSDLLLHCLSLQHYAWRPWYTTDTCINYRRFFTINSLISLNMQDPAVFSAFHSYIETLVKEGVFSGLRVDHIDGLYCPTTYLTNLKKTMGDRYVVVEKILQSDEELPPHWLCEGTTGYDFLALINNLFTNSKAAEKLKDYYENITGKSESIEELIAEKKQLILHRHMSGDLDNLCRLFRQSELADMSLVSDEEVRQAISLFLVACPVYRYYSEQMPLQKKERQAVSGLFQKIREAHPRLAAGVDLLEYALILHPVVAGEEYRQKAAHFFLRCMQFTGPLMAKGVEDTLMYDYNCFVAHNEVGDTPASFGISVDNFHKKMMERQRRFPLTMNATATHDTKRGEDFRARLNVLSDIPEKWLSAVEQWRQMNAHLTTGGLPDAQDEYFIYQTLAGSYPLASDGVNDYQLRIEQYLEKAVREAKRHSSWAKPDEEYEGAVRRFVQQLFSEKHCFWNSFLQFVEKIADAGMLNALAQLMVKCMAPGIPDFYQGSELWDFNLVDPDNRRSVDYALREQMLEQIRQLKPEEAAQKLWDSRHSGAIKLWLTRLLLRERKNNPRLFDEGTYLPLKAEGKYAQNVYAFARRFGDDWYICVVPLYIASLDSVQSKSLPSTDWQNTRIHLRPEMPECFEELLSRKNGKAEEVALYLRDLFGFLPLALLKLRRPDNPRGAGVLLAVTSLPSPFGVGDLGKQAYQFIRFLSRSRQRYWQILPLNPTSAGAGHSPYSSFSAFAGNPLLISPELLAENGLLEHDLVEQSIQPVKETADYAFAEDIRNVFLKQAYDKFCSGNFPKLEQQYERFCKEEAHWLEDMTLYKVLKEHQDNQPWYEWEPVYRNREPNALEQFALTHAARIRYTKWLQFIFDQQWQALRKFAHINGIRIFGDIPFYISYDSVDVWAHRRLFCLDEKGNRQGVAGVPPDYFSEDGQLWGMPTFNWQALEKEGYAWWIARLKKNLNLYDLVRIDHFRAFENYWQVPASEDKATHGKWLRGPGKAFFDAVLEKLGSLPFVAEDLGDHMEEVYALRKSIGLPGMKVLQFAWGANMPDSVDAPHHHEKNSVIYTGTHDNNTTKGWYEEETNRADHRRMHHYLGLKVRQKNISDVMARVAYRSVGTTVILPMQDILGLGTDARMNTPGKTEGNWLWRLTPQQLNEAIEKTLCDWVVTYGR